MSKWNKIWLLCILNFSFIAGLFGQDDILYSSDLEKVQFDNIRQGKAFDTLALFFYLSENNADGLKQVRDALDNLHNKLMAKKRFRKKPMAYLDALNANYEASVLKVFEVGADFSTLIYTREFNHNTAAYLFAYYMQKGQIPVEFSRCPRTRPRTVKKGNCYCQRMGKDFGGHDL